MGKIKTVADVIAAPFTEKIETFVGPRCPFCGALLPSYSVGFGRDKCYQYDNCSCPTYKAAKAHNAIYEALEEEEKLAKKALVAKARKPKVEKTPVELTLGEILTVATGVIILGVSPRDAEDKVQAAMENAGLKKGSVKDRLMTYAKKQGFSLKEAAEDVRSQLNSGNYRSLGKVMELIKDIGEKYNLPETITIK